MAHSEKQEIWQFTSKWKQCNSDKIFFHKWRVPGRKKTLAPNFFLFPFVHPHFSLLTSHVLLHLRIVTFGHGLTFAWFAEVPEAVTFYPVVPFISQAHWAHWWGCSAAPSSSAVLWGCTPAQIVFCSSAAFISSHQQKMLFNQNWDCFWCMNAVTQSLRPSITLTPLQLSCSHWLSGLKKTNESTWWFWWPGPM